MINMADITDDAYKTQTIEKAIAMKNRAMEMSKKVLQVLDNRS